MLTYKEKVFHTVLVGNKKPYKDKTRKQNLIADIKNLRKEGKTMAEIGAELGMKKSAIAQCMRRNGIK